MVNLKQIFFIRPYHDALYDMLGQRRQVSSLSCRLCGKMARTVLVTSGVETYCGLGLYNSELSGPSLLLPQVSSLPCRLCGKVALTVWMTYCVVIYDVPGRYN